VTLVKLESQFAGVSGAVVQVLRKSEATDLQSERVEPRESEERGERKVVRSSRSRMEFIKL
jgi:hypothetical protein